MTDSDDVVIESTDEDGETTSQDVVKKLRAERDHARKEAAENLAGWQRAKADYVNLQGRMRTLGDDLSKGAIRALAEAFIPVADSLEAAVGHDPGLKATLKQLDEAFKVAGITRFTPKSGEIFDPVRHESVQVLATENEKEDNTVSTCLQSGYELGGTIIRPARVTIYHHG